MHQVIEFYEQNLQLARETGDFRGEMGALGSLGRAYEALNEKEKALECFEFALRIARKIGDAHNERVFVKSINSLAGTTNDKTPSRIKSKKKSSAASSPCQPSPGKKVRSRPSKKQ